MVKSRQYTLLFLMIILMQPCLVDAKVFIVRKCAVSNLNSNIHTATTDSASPCEPHQHQIKHYNGLYSSVANNFNGNIKYYALRTVEAHNNRTEPTVTAEDNAIIANITDHSRFVPAGMELANKVVVQNFYKRLMRY